MHDSCHAWVAKMVADYDLADLGVLEVGSRIVNGTVRDLFTGHYVGVDREEGPGVDFVGDAESLPWPVDTGNRWAVVLCLEVLEHVEHPWRVMAELARVSRQWVIVSARGYDVRGCWPVHDYPQDLWRFSFQSMFVMAEDAGLQSVVCVPDPEGPGWFLHGRVDK